MSEKRYVLDSFAVLAYLLREIVPDRALVLRAARIKAHYAVSYADAFVAALAEQWKATVVTGDPEFQQVPSLAVKWLPHA